MVHSLFTYGSLQHAPTLEALIARVPPHEPAELTGFSQSKVRGRVYPGIREAPGARTHGVVWHAVDDIELELIDRFEGEAYQRTPVTFTRADGSTGSAFTYVVAASRVDLLTDEPWDLDDYRARHAREFAAECAAFRVRQLAAIIEARS